MYIIKSPELQWNSKLATYKVIDCHGPWGISLYIENKNQKVGKYEVDYDAYTHDYTLDLRNRNKYWFKIFIFQNPSS